MRHLPSKLLLSVMIVVGCGPAGAQYCELFEYTAPPSVLLVSENYYVLPRQSDSMISLMLRYKDLSAPEELYDGYSPQELRDPNWSIDLTNYTALLQVYRHKIIPPSTQAELQQSYPKMREVESDWPGSTKLEECPKGCQQVFYVGSSLRESGVSYVLCYEVENRDPLQLGCGAHALIQGLHVVFHFPAAKKRHFSEFKSRIEAFLQKLAAESEANCRSN